MLKDGIHHNTNPAEYHAWGIDKNNLTASPMSCSQLKQFARSPYIWKIRDTSPPDSDALQWGRLVDTLLLTPNQFPHLYKILPDDAPAKPTAAMRSAKKNGDAAAVRIAFWDNFLAEAEGLEVVKYWDYNNASYAVREVEKHPVASEILHNCNPQTAAVFTKGVPWKILIDIVPNSEKWRDCLVDFKTTGSDLDDPAIEKTIYKFKYHWQAALYLWVWNSVAPEDQKRSRFAFIFQNSDTKEVRVVELDRTAIETAMGVLRVHMADYLRRVRDDDWASRYETGVSRVFLPHFGTYEEEAFIDASENKE